MASLQLKLLGGFALRLKSGRAVDVSGKKNQALLAYLALNPGRKFTREKLAGLLWSDREDTQARGSLRQALVALRRDLDETDQAPLIFEGDAVAIAPSSVSTDIAEFERLAASTVADDLRQAAELYEGDLMDGIAVQDPAFEDWLSIERSRLRDIATSILERLIDHESGAKAIMMAKRLIALDPLREVSHRALMRAYASQGQLDQAIRRYRLCRETLRRELDVGLSAETEALYRQICGGSFRPHDRDEAPAAAQEASSITAGAPALPLTEKPSIAVLPFTNMSGDVEQDYLADGITENIITGLSRFRDLFVIARHSTFAYKGKAMKIQDVSHELGVRYILGGSVQRSSDRLRISVQLIDGPTGRDLWAECYDRGMEDVFGLQAEVTQTIVATLATAYGGRLRKVWRQREEGAGPRNFQAIDYFQRGMEFLNRLTREDNERAKEQFRKAAELDPNYAKPLAKISWSHMIDAMFGWTENPAESWAHGLDFATKAVECDDDESWGHWASAGYYQHLGQFDHAISEYQKALELNPNDADVLTDFAWCLNWTGRHEEGLEMARWAMRLNPHYPEWYVLQLGQIYHDARRYEDAIATLEDVPHLDTVWGQLFLASSHANLGHADAARKAVERALEIDPKVTLQWWTSPEVAPYKDPRDLEHYRDGLRKAGLSE
jgi:TolB-like protein